jgi:ribosomal protein L37E
VGKPAGTQVYNHKKKPDLHITARRCRRHSHPSTTLFVGMFTSGRSRDFVVRRRFAGWCAF